MRQRTGTRPRAARRLAAAAAIAALLVGALPAQSVSANEPGDSVYTRTSDTERLAYARVVRLEHSGAANGTLLATFEHATVDGTPSEFVIRRSLDDGETWSTIATVGDPLTGKDHPSDQMWQPFFYELPTAMGEFPAGTLLLAGNIAPSTKERTDFVLWRSTDHGETWDFQSVLQTGGGSIGAVNGGTGVWEPFLTTDGDGRLAMYFSDERPEPEHAQVIAHMVSNDGGVTWSANPDGSTNFAPGLVIDVQSDTATDRPGMPTVATMPDGTMALAYEICGAGRNCEAHVKLSDDGGETWGSGPSDLGTMAVTTDGRYLGSSPYLVWSPEGGPDGQLMLTGMRTRFADTNAFTREDRQAVFIGPPDGEGPWTWTPAPFRPTVESAQHCSTSYSPHLLLSSEGDSARFTTATSVGGTGCMEGTAVGSVGQLPYASDFHTGQSAWIDYGGCWSTSGGVLSETCGGNGGNKAVTGNTGWRNYTLEGDVRIDTGPQAGFVLRATDPRVGADRLDGYYVGVSATGTLMLGRQDGTWTPLASAEIPGGLERGDWYHISVRATGCRFTITGEPADGGTPVTFAHTDPGCFHQGAVGVRAQTGTASWRDITVTEL
ncbi:glycoside hydrolase [Glycomyces sp. A-F 0318]|uniref:family 16 glycoside hydrolase n=1 Tax=Glycomyces amatae TaxID=2881355 RepID=UPI001E473244|nr:sialidase family protein [Glycomyces amatae]MCD0447303.1 glycoside hydrolase [Glycomyces amatae]